MAYRAAQGLAAQCVNGDNLTLAKLAEKVLI